MDKEQIKTFASKVTYASAKVEYKTGEFFVGFFQNTSKSVELEKENKWSFIENNNAIAYNESGDEKFATILDGENIMRILSPA